MKILPKWLAWVIVTCGAGFLVVGYVAALVSQFGWAFGLAFFIVPLVVGAALLRVLGD